MVYYSPPQLRRTTGMSGTSENDEHGIIGVEHVRILQTYEEVIEVAITWSSAGVKNSGGLETVILPTQLR